MAIDYSSFDRDQPLGDSATHPIEESRMMHAPVFFISHGAPTFAIEPGALGLRLRALGRQLNGIKAVLVVSPHWQTRAVTVMTTPRPTTLHDFGGFPPSLYALQYPASGDPDRARLAHQLLDQAGFSASEDDQRGFDHGVWVPLLHLLPTAQRPVFQVSMPTSLTSAQALRMGQALAPLRAQGVMIIGSGSMTHNLAEFNPAATTPQPYVQEFTAWVNAVVRADDAQSLVNYHSLAPHAQRAHPTQEHFLPLLLALGASGGDAVQAIDAEISHGMLSMQSYVWGLTAQDANAAAA